MIHLINIPDALLAWGRDPTTTKRWADKRLVERIDALRAKASEEKPLSKAEADKLLGHLESLVHEAIAAGKHDLVHELDLGTAELLDLTYRSKRPDGRDFVVGRDGEYTFEELRVVMDAESPKELAAFTDQVKALFADADWFDGGDARVRIVAAGRDEEKFCSSCAAPLTSCMLVTDTGGQMCRECWHGLTGPVPEHLRELLADGVKERKRR